MTNHSETKDALTEINALEAAKTAWQAPQIKVISAEDAESGAPGIVDAGVLS